MTAVVVVNGRIPHTLLKVEIRKFDNEHLLSAKHSVSFYRSVVAHFYISKKLKKYF